jgi:hypothetical protein
MPAKLVTNANGSRVPAEGYSHYAPVAPRNSSSPSPPGAPAPAFVQSLRRPIVVRPYSDAQLVKCGDGWLIDRRTPESPIVLPCTPIKLFKPRRRADAAQTSQGENQVKTLLTPEQQMEILRRAAIERENARSGKNYNSLKK